MTKDSLKLASLIRFYIYPYFSTTKHSQYPNPRNGGVKITTPPTFDRITNDPYHLFNPHTFDFNQLSGDIFQPLVRSANVSVFLVHIEKKNSLINL